MTESVAQTVKHQMKWLVSNALERYGRKQLWPKSWFKLETKQMLAEVLTI
jgi:hypothetical protein